MGTWDTIRNTVAAEFSDLGNATELTQLVVRLLLEGLSNKEIAQKMEVLIKERAAGVVVGDGQPLVQIAEDPVQSVGGDGAVVDDVPAAAVRAAATRGVAVAVGQLRDACEAALAIGADLCALRAVAPAGGDGRRRDRSPRPGRQSSFRARAQG